MNKIKFGPGDLEQLFTVDLLNQAKDYYQKNLVKNVMIKGNIISGRVIDPPRTYIIRAKFEKNYVLSYCTCKSGKICVHTAALFLQAVEEMNTPLLKKLENIMNSPYDEQEECFPVTPDKQYSEIETRFEHIFTTTLPVMTPYTYHYKLAFTVIDCFEKLMIKAIKVYVKKNGEYGRAVTFLEGGITEPVTEHEQTLLTSLLVGEHGIPESDLSDHLGYLIHHKIFLYDPHYKRQIRMMEISFVEIRFKINRHTIAPNFTFFPFFVLYDKDKNTIADMVSSYRLHRKGGYLFVYNESDCILCYRYDHTLCNLLTAIINCVDFYYPADITSMSRYIKKNFQDRCSVCFPYERTKIVSPRPGVIVKIDSPGGVVRYRQRRNRKKRNSGKKLYITYCFTYSGIEVDYNQSEKIIADPGSFDQPELILIKRNREFEKTCVDYINSFLEPVTIKEYGDFWYHQNGLVITIPLVLFMKEYGLALIERGVLIKIKDKKVSSRVLLAYKIATGIDWFDIHTMAVDEKGNKKDIHIDPDLLPKGIVTAGDDYVFLTREDAEKLASLVAGGMGKDGKMKTHKANFFLLDTIYHQVENKDEEFEKYKSISDKLKNFSSMEHVMQPAGFKGVLRDYQKAGYDWLYFLFSCSLNACLADDMGLGKTIQTLCLLQKLKELDKFYTSLLILPVVTISNWEHEIDRFTPGMSVLRHSGPKRTKDIRDLMGYDLVLVSYQTLRNDIEFFCREKFFYIILDESQYVKNAATQTFKAVRCLKSDHKLSLTGTPVENNLFELWAQMNILNPGLLGSIGEFRRKYINPIERGKDGGKKEKEYLRKITYPFILRRKKQDVLQDLPPKEVIIHYSEMGRQQKKIYAALRAYYRQKIRNIMNERNRGKGKAIDVFAAILKVRQIALFPDLVSEEYKEVESCKFESVKLLVDEIRSENHKILIFSQFVQVLNRIKTYFDNRGYTYSCITGQTRDRDSEIRKFQNDDTTGLFLLSLKAGGTGINLTAADYVIIYDPWWNPAVEQQAMDRSHRIGQTEKVTVYKMIVKDTIEEKMLKLQKQKQKMVDELITAEDGIYKSLSADDIAELFE